MNILFTGLFWGVILIILGIVVILKAVLNINIPVFRILFAVVLIYFGLKLLVGRKIVHNRENSIIFEKSRVSSVQGNKEYNVIFGSGIIDLTDIDLSNGSVETEINVIFASGDIILESRLPVYIKASTAFAECKLPRGRVSFLGDHQYKSDNFNKDEPALLLDVSVVFGNANIITR